MLILKYNDSSLHESMLEWLKKACFTPRVPIGAYVGSEM